MNTNRDTQNFTDISAYDVEAECDNCHRVVITLRENCWTDDSGKLFTDCMCSELG